MILSVRAQKLLLWWSLIFVAIYGAAWLFLLRMVPPPSPVFTPSEVAAYYAERYRYILPGSMIAAWTSGFLVPLATVITAQMIRAEQGWSVLSLLQVAGGTMNSILLVLPPNFWGATAFHPQRAADATVALNDLSNLTLVTTDQYYMYQFVPIVIVSLLSRQSPESPFKRWFGYFTAWAMLVFEFGPFGFMFRQGVFAWDGLFVFWLPFLCFFLWLAVLYITFFQCLARQTDSRVS